MSRSLRPAVRLLAAGLAAALALSACGSSDSGDGAGAEAWSFTDGSGETITLDAVPERIIASDAEAVGLLSYGIKPVGIYLSAPLETLPQLKDVDLTGIEIIGETWGQMDAEKAAALKPDLIVADYWTAQKTHQGFGEGVDEESNKVAELAPVIGAEQEGSLEDVVQWYEDFAASLGKDTETDGKKRFEAAKADFISAVEAKPGLTALAVSPAQEMLYVAEPDLSTSLYDFREWGLDVVKPKNPNKDHLYWEYLSWENADTYQADLLLLDDRVLAAQPNAVDELGGQFPTWNSIKAAKEKAVTAWPGFWIHSWDQYAEQVENLTAAIEKADENLT